jgi:pimeloyl-ACP methyl ester carboxylesterase
MAEAEVFTIRNAGTADLILSNISLSDTTNFALSSSGGNSCNILDGTVKPNASCTITVSFCPKRPVPFSATMRITSNDPNVPLYDVQLTGTGKAGKLRISDSSYDLGFGVVGGCSEPSKVITLENAGDWVLTIHHVSLKPDDFIFLQNDEGAPCPEGSFGLEPGAACTKTVRFCPTAGGKREGELTVSSDDLDHPSLAIGLAGTATTNGWLVTIDGVYVLSIPLLGFSGSDFGSQYLYDKITDPEASEAIKKIRVDLEGQIGTIIPFHWSRDYWDSGDTVDNLGSLLKALTANKALGSPLVILSHSWGTVLSYAAIRKNPETVNVSTYITLGSPLNDFNPSPLVPDVIRSFTRDTLGLRFGILTVAKPENVSYWKNHWAVCDLVSGRIDSADINRREIPRPKMSNIILGPRDCHAWYFDDEKTWEKILKGILQVN